MGAPVTEFTTCSFPIDWGDNKDVVVSVGGSKEEERGMATLKGPYKNLRIRGGDL